jgi:hypothetical protein
LDELTELLDYYSNGKGGKFQVIGELKALVHEFGQDEKEHNIRLIQKWKEKHEKQHR